MLQNDDENNYNSSDSLSANNLNEEDSRVSEEDKKSTSERLLAPAGSFVRLKRALAVSSALL